MEKFEIKGDNGFIKIAIKVFGFPNQALHFDGFECRADVEIKIPSYHVKGDLYTSTGGIFRFYEELNKCQIEVSGEANYFTLEGNFVMKIEYNELGQTEITGKFQQSMGVLNCLEFEINSDQSFLKYTRDELEAIANKYGHSKGVKNKAISMTDIDNKTANWKFWKKK